jgi:hypothetical protein
MTDNIKDKLIYVSQPYGGDPENYTKAEQIVSALSKLYPDYCFVSPILCFGHMYDEISYEQGMELCLTLLDQCAEMWVFGDSKGVQIEREYATKYKIPIIEGAE